MSRLTIKETLYPHWGQYFTNCTVLEKINTGNQELLLADSPGHGKVLLLDGIVQLTQNGHHTYHEMIAHPALFAHPDAREILIIGGGDGGVAREVLRHTSIEKIVMVEIDQSVVNFSVEHFPDVSMGAFNDPRFHLIIGNGAAHVASISNQFDIIIVDSTDPVEGLSEVLFTTEFYVNCHSALKKNGILITQNGVPRQQPAELTITLSYLKESGFNNSTCYLIDAPDYVGGQMALGWATKGPPEYYRSVNAVTAAFIRSSFGGNLHYYNPHVHFSAFALPNYVLKLV